MRAQLLTLKKAEFVEATEMVGASDFRILRRHLLPHLVPTMLVWGAIAVGTNILLEVSLSFIGSACSRRRRRWGSLLSTAWGTLYGRATFGELGHVVADDLPDGSRSCITVVSLNQLSEGIRRATRSEGGSVRRVAQFFARRIAAARVHGARAHRALVRRRLVAVPSDTASFVYPHSQHLSAYQIKHADHLLGVDRPLPTQYLDYVEASRARRLRPSWRGAKLVQTTTT